MARKHGVAASPAKRQRRIEGIEIVTALREGRLTRGQFEAWHEMRRRSGVGFIITMRAKPDAPDKPAKRRHRAR